MPELLSMLVDIPKVPSRIRTGGFLWNQAGAGILYGGSRRLREGRCCRHTSIPNIHGMLYVLRLKDILYILRDRRVTNVERMLSNLTKSEKIARKTHFCKTNGKEKAMKRLLTAVLVTGGARPAAASERSR